MALIPAGKPGHFAAAAVAAANPASVTLSVSPASPAHGDTVTATYTVTGNNPGAPAVAAVNGDVTIGGSDYKVSATVTLPGTPALPEAFAVPTCPGLTFKATAQPNVFTAAVP